MRFNSSETGRPTSLDTDLCEARIGDTAALAVGRSGDIYWFENDAEGGPQLCRYFAAENAAMS